MTDNTELTGKVVLVTGASRGIGYAAAVDGVGKEDLFFGLDGDGALNSKGELRASLTPLQRFLASGKPVFLIEYLETPEAKALAHKNAEALGVPLFIGSRELDDVRSR